MKESSAAPTAPTTDETLMQTTLDALNAGSANSLISTLGIQYTYATAQRVEATMPVALSTRQPFGLLHGGASLALAETVAGVGSIILAGADMIMVGMQVSGNHVGSALEGDTVLATATLLHGGRSTHVWNVDIVSQATGRLVSTVRVLNSVRPKPTK